MMERVNYETFVINHLRESGFEAFADVPDGKLVPKPDSYVTVEMTSSTTDGVAVGEVTLAVQSWSTSRYAASELAERVDVAMFKLVNNDNPITHVTRNALYNYPTSQMEPRYQGTYDLVGHIIQ